jgi:hypothetical protein
MPGKEKMEFALQSTGNSAIASNETSLFSLLAPCF